jgi:SAM-dependent methyltransferase
VLIKDSSGNFRFFDSVQYLHLNPDLAAKIESGEVPSPESHYLRFGQHEGRAGVPLLSEVFDEEAYLAENADVAAAIGLGNFASGYEHFVKYGHKEGRSGAPDPQNPPELSFPGPLPPSELRKRVHGVTQRSSFERVGSAIAETLLNIAAPHISRGKDAAQVLDFGCGCGRVLAYLKQGADVDVVGADIDEEAILWCRQNLSDFADFRVNSAAPPMDFPSDAFDFIYSISVMTHLPETMQKAWLAELARIAKPGALVILTTRGVHGVDLSWWQRQRFNIFGFGYGGGRLTPGLPDFYRSAFHAEAYVRRHWSKVLEVLEFRPRGLIGDQDLVICRKAARSDS